MHPDQFRHRIPITARFGDVDMLGHVNNAKYATYLEEARLQYARDVMGNQTDSRQVGMIVARLVIDYLLPLHEGDTVQIWTRCSRLGRKSFDLSYLMVKAETEELVATAVTTMVAYDYDQQSSVLIGETWRQQITDYEPIMPEQR